MGLKDDECLIMLGCYLSSPSSQRLGDEGGVYYYTIAILQGFACPAECLIVDHCSLAHIRGDLFIKYILAFQHLQSNQVGPQDRIALNPGNLLARLSLPGARQATGDKQNTRAQLAFHESGKRFFQFATSLYYTGYAQIDLFIVEIKMSRLLLNFTLYHISLLILLSALQIFLRKHQYETEDMDPL
jgi:hypothetical protein